MQPVNRRVKFIFSIFQLFHRQFRFPPLVLGEKDMILTGDDFDLLKNIGIDGKILYTPGHSRDSISVILSDGSAFVGDVAMNFLRLTGIGHRPIYVEDIDTVYESWQRLIEQGAEVIYPSHGNPFSARNLCDESRPNTRFTCGEPSVAWRSRQVERRTLDHGNKQYESVDYPGLTANDMIAEPVHTLDDLCKSFNGATSRADRSQIGQFLTHASIAEFLSSMTEGLFAYSRTSNFTEA